ncbi:alpha-E domain-containing protein [Roseomonas sp. E05]|uniref:alpha-E domain-containing protein n=1 Tax=Roseomonas sp. E05 TaxID=3046310 RepID=UPI0024BA3BAB|nr:alpha-E domain-containing protein [Roseomonas sp. E05]MDJ0389605.1 alpha-E domain-containing protein [Roseomonas sp. E05]
MTEYDPAPFYCAALTAEAVLQFHVTDRENLTSIASAIALARENVRILRPIAPSGIWAQLNVFRRWLSGLDDAALAPSNFARLLGQIKGACQAHAGIAKGTLHRDQGSYFHRLGPVLERADQAIRLLGIKYHLLLSKVSDAGPPIGVVQWNVLLRSAAADHAYLRAVPSGVSPAGVAGFLLLHPRFPRPVAFVSEAVRLLAVLRSRHALTAGAGVEAELRKLHAALGALTIKEVLRQGLHQFLGGIQQRLITASTSLAGAFFDREANAAQPQSQNWSTPCLS